MGLCILPERRGSEEWPIWFGAFVVILMLAMVGGHHLVSESDATSAESALEAALRGPSLEPTAESETLLAEWSAERQMAHLMSSLGCGVATDPPEGQGHHTRESGIGVAQP